MTLPRPVTYNAYIQLENHTLLVHARLTESGLVECLWQEQGLDVEIEVEREAVHFLSKEISQAASTLLKSGEISALIGDDGLEFVEWE